MILKKLLIFLFRFIVIFGFLFELNFGGSITSRRLSCIIALLTLLIEKKKVRNLLCYINKMQLEKSLFLFFLYTLILFIHYVIVTRNVHYGYMEPWYIVNIILYNYIFALYCVIHFSDIVDFSKVYVTCFCVQTIAVIASIISTDFRLLLFSLFYTGDDRFNSTIEAGTRIMGINLHSATGGMLLGSNAALLIYLIINKKVNNTIFLLLYMITTFTAAFISRTGLLLCVCLLLSYYAFMGIKKMLRNLCFVSIMSLGLVYAIPNVLSQSDTQSADILIEWMLESFSNEGISKTTSGINQTELPDFTSDLIWGTSMEYGRLSNGAYVKSDSGYVRLILAVGFIGAFFYYMAFINYFKIVPYRKDLINKRFMLLLILSSFVLEIKEPFSLKYIYNYIIFTMLLFSLKEYIQSNTKIKI